MAHWVSDKVTYWAVRWQLKRTFSQEVLHWEIFSGEITYQEISCLSENRNLLCLVSICWPPFSQIYWIMTDIIVSTKWVHCTECWFEDKPESTNGDSVTSCCQQNGSAVQNVDSRIDQNQQIKLSKQEKQQIVRWDSPIHINKFVDQQYGSTNQIVVSGPTSTTNWQRGSCQLYPFIGS